jgi:hypothetical protein
VEDRASSSPAHSFVFSLFLLLSFFFFIPESESVSSEILLPRPSTARISTSDLPLIAFASENFLYLNKQREKKDEKEVSFRLSLAGFCVNA